MVTDHEDWLDVKAEDAKDNTTVEEETNEVHKYTLDTKVEDINAVVESYRVNHPEVKTSLGEKSVVKVRVLVGSSLVLDLSIAGFTVCPSSHRLRDRTNNCLWNPNHLQRFLRTKVTNTRRNRSYNCSQTSARGPELSLGETLDSILLLYTNAAQEMLASYIDVKSSPCIKCRRLLDQNAQFPVVRMRKRTKGPDGLFVTQWLAFHIGCT